MKIAKQRRNNKKKNYGSPSISRELADNKWWQLVHKLNPKEKQSVYKIF